MLALGLLALVAAQLPVASAFDAKDILGEAKAAEEWIVEQRRELHKIPETGFATHRTAAKIKEVLDELKIPYKCVVIIPGSR